MNHPIVSVDWLADNILSKDLIILDASPQSNVSGLVTAYDNIRIPGARYIDLKADLSNSDSPLPNTIPTPAQFEASCQKLGICMRHKLVVYDNLGIYTSPRVRWLFRAMGHEDVYVLDGGLPAWVNSGQATEPTAEQSYELGDFKADFKPDFLKSMDQLVENLKTREFIVFDARSAGRFMGTSPEPREGLSSGHIPSSISIPFETVLENGHFKSNEDLITLFTKPYIEDQDFVFSCGSGLTACIIELASTMVMKNKTAIYDGSWTEWANDPKTPIIITTKS